MKLHELKKILQSIESVDFKIENENFIPKNFHVTEIGQITKEFIDCGGLVRKEKKVNFQLWNTTDYNHRLKPYKFLDIIKIFEEKFNIEDGEIEVEYQNETIGKYNLDFNGEYFVLLNKKTMCLAEDQCGISIEKPKEKLATNIGQDCCNQGNNCR